MGGSRRVVGARAPDARVRAPRSRNYCAAFGRVALGWVGLHCVPASLTPQGRYASAPPMTLRATLDP
ncbi:hypothetical protein GCM10009764_88830 [Nocardia ninae]|uniref:Uncharacterized protein n=1 Tax=Nocardia ninae NBRC 108245 TaxID=1210091 RepID=A0A511MUG1_9NOCA|nr:hypothetical protein NN4_82350 [Nocardia ninae NBRC 108245]